MTLIITTALFVFGIFFCQEDSLGILLFSVFALTVEKICSSGHIYLAMITNAVLASQIYVYEVSIHSPAVMASYMMVKNSEPPTPIFIEDILCLVSFFTLWFGGHIPRSGSWKESRVPNFSTMRAGTMGRISPSGIGDEPPKKKLETCLRIEEEEEDEDENGSQNLLTYETPGGAQEDVLEIE